MLFMCIKTYKTTSMIVEVGDVCLLKIKDFDLYLYHKSGVIPISEDNLDECFRKVVIM